MSFLGKIRKVVVNEIISFIDGYSKDGVENRINSLKEQIIKMEYLIIQLHN